MSLPQKKPNALIGIDTGVKTGLAVWLPAEKKLVKVETYSIDWAMAVLKDQVAFYGSDILVRVEDARQAVHGRGNQGYKLRGVGSVMRDAKIWEDFLAREKIPFKMIRPRKEFTKWKADVFNKFTGWKGRTTSHGRDAAMLVYGY